MRNGIFPAKRLIMLSFIPLILFSLSFRFNILIAVGLCIDAIFFLLILFDLFLSPDFKKKLVINVIAEKYFVLDRYSEFKLSIENKNGLWVKFNFLLDLDISFDREYSHQLLKIGPKETRDITMKIFPSRRGEFKSSLFFVKGRSLLGFLTFYRKYKHELTINVYPTTYSQGESFRFLNKEIKKIEGYQKNKVIGDGKDFQMLRDYVKGDEFNKIDWNKTAKTKKPLVRVYRLENNFELSIMIDCGRLMSTEIKGMSMLDYAVNTSLVLAYAGIKGNDSVSFTAFGSNIIKYVPPSKNIRTIQRLNLVLTDLQYEFAESNYQTAFGFIKTKLSKRSLVVLFTDIIDDTNIKTYHKYLSMLKKKHIVLLVLLRDKILFEAADGIPGKTLSVYTKAAACDMILRRNKTIMNLKRLGIEVLDLFFNFDV